MEKDDEQVEAYRKNAHEVVDFVFDYLKNVSGQPVLSKVHLFSYPIFQDETWRNNIQTPH
jgi:hypothetical protein